MGKNKDKIMKLAKGNQILGKCMYQLSYNLHLDYEDVLEDAIIKLIEENERLKTT